MVMPFAEKPNGMVAWSVSAEAGVSPAAREAIRTADFKRFVFIGENFLSMPQGAVFENELICAHGTGVRKGIFSEE